MMAMQHGTMVSYGPHPLHAEIPTIVFHGDEDTMVHATHAAQFMRQAPRGTTGTAAAARYTESVARQARRHGYTRTVLLDERKRIFSEQWIVHGGGHAWSGGSAEATYTDANGPDATREMMRFFMERRR